MVAGAMSNQLLEAQPNDVAFIKVNNRWWALRDHKWIPITGTSADHLPIHYDQSDPYEKQIAEALTTATKK